MFWLLLVRLTCTLRVLDDVACNYVVFNLSISVHSLFSFLLRVRPKGCWRGDVVFQQLVMLFYMFAWHRDRGCGIWKLCEMVEGMSSINSKWVVCPSG